MFTELSLAFSNMIIVCCSRIRRVIVRCFFLYYSKVVDPAVLRKVVVSCSFLSRVVVRLISVSVKPMIKMQTTFLLPYGDVDAFLEVPGYVLARFSPYFLSVSNFWSAYFSATLLSMLLEILPTTEPNFCNVFWTLH